MGWGRAASIELQPRDLRTLQSHPRTPCLGRKFASLGHMVAGMYVWVDICPPPSKITNMGPHLETETSSTLQFTSNPIATIYHPQPVDKGAPGAHR